MFAISLSTNDPRFRHSTISSRGSTTTAHASGETESYLEQIETAYRNRISELTPGCMKSCGATTELRSNDLPSFIKKANSAEAMATEIAIKEIIEAM